MQSPQSENRMSMRVCHIRHTLFLSFSMVAYFSLSATQLPLAVNSMYCNCSLWPLQARMFCVLLPCVFMWNNYPFCLVLEINLTLKEPFLRTNRSPCCKKSILTKVCLDAKRGGMWMLAKWIFIWRARHLHPFQDYLVQNGVRFGAKWRAFWC